MRPAPLLRLAAAMLLSCALSGIAGTSRAAEPAAGDVPPDIVGMNIDHDPVKLSQYAGKAVVISFWATWCPYCLKELPVLSAIQKAAKGNVHVIAINTEDRDVFRRSSRVLRDLGIELAYDPDQTAQTAYGVSGIPHMVIIGRDGKIVNVYRGYNESSLNSIVAAINRATGATP
jgi:thiol-disulfide isomerase/thioredoxin